MIKFDKDGFFIGQKVNTKIQHEENHICLYPEEEKKIDNLEYDKLKYVSHGHTTHKETVMGKLQIVYLYQTDYKGKKFKEWNKKGSGALAIICKLKKTNKITIVKVLIPK